MRTRSLSRRPNSLSSEPSTPSTPNVSDADGKKKKKKKKKLNFEDTVMNMTFKVNEVHLEISTLPREDAGGWVPQLVIDIRDVVIQSTNSSWEVVKLSAANDVDKKQALKRTYKQLTCQSLSVNLIQLDGSPMSLVKRIPAEIRVAACLNTDMDEYTAITVDMLFEEVPSPSSSFPRVSSHPLMLVVTRPHRSISQPTSSRGK